MRYGYFSPLSREYIVERPDTPRPWSNYMGGRIYGGVVTNHGGGYSFTQSPAEGRILRHRYNSVPAEQPGRPFYIRDDADGDFWSAAWQPVGKPLDQYKSLCRFGTNYTIISSAYHGIETETAYFVPHKAACEVWHLKIKNTGSTPRKLSVFSFAEFTSEWNLLNDLLNLQYTMYIARASYADGFITASSCGNLAPDEGNFANRDQGRYWWMTHTGGEAAGHECDRDTFLGKYRSFDRPIAVERGNCTNSPGYSDNTCGAFHRRIELAPGETAEMVVLIGPGSATKEGRDCVARYGTGALATAALSELRAFWHSKLDAISVETPDQAFNHMANTWNSYNALITFEWSRSFSLVYTGIDRDGYGYRDTVQDCLGVTHLVPDEVRSRLILMLSGQESHGGAMPEIRPWHHHPGKMPPTPEAKLRSDDCLWFFNSIPAYVAETGDDAFYDLVVPYSDKGTATVLGHLRRALEFNLQRTGANGIPCGLSADWNDCLKLGYKGESIFVAFQVRYGLVEYSKIAEKRDLTAELSWAREQLAALDARIQKTCWDGEWFLWAIGEDGTRFGSKNYPEGQVYLNTQAWAVMSGAATEEQAKSSLAAVEKRLATPYGLKLCDPAFVKTPVEVMRAVLFNPGNKENGGIFSHTQSWGVLAEIARGDGDRAFRYYKAFLPAAQNESADLRQIEPYAHCQSTHAEPSPKAGTSRVPWLSGTASWANYAAIHGILGLQAEVDGFRIDPCIPSTWSGFKARRNFRGKILEISVRNPRGHATRGLSQLTVNGETISGNFIPLNKLTPTTRIEAEIA